MNDELKLELILLVICVILVRILFLMHKITTGYSRQVSKSRTTPCKAIICIGSGGHTTEMLQLVRSIDITKYNPRTYVMAASDKSSLSKIEKFEELIAQNDVSKNYKIIAIPRSRKLHQSYLTSIITTLYSILYSIPIILKIRPDLILCNGPGTCIPICGVSFLLKCCFILDTRIVFIESYCRTKTLSLTGKILIYFADNFLVQWPSLKHKIKRAEYIGQLM